MVRPQLCRLGNSNQVEILEEVIAIGNPLGLENTSSTGVISQKRTKNGFNMLQTTAPVSPGNSGGPLVNLKGQVIGIVTEQMREGQNLNFALPINYVRASLESNTEVKFTLPQIAEAQGKKDQEEAVATLASMLAVYEDKYKTYEAVVPKSWRFEKTEGWSEDKQSYNIIAMTSPESAARAEVNGYLSEGIRITISMPPKGKVWTAASPAEYAAFVSKNMLEDNPGFVQTSTSSATVGQEPLKILEFVGQNPNIAEPERDRFYVLAKPECHIIS